MSRVPLASFRFPVPAIRLPQWLELAPNSELVLFVTDLFIQSTALPSSYSWMAICVTAVTVVGR